ncbi:putative kinase [Tripterygium wilfordii]|uniref:non-specific serine/threonine protein kinase n=1 Tax=Tripterygium wilfordii TaxID=458696 RepID=A0A7J7CB70_TRIWF|nr:probable L-type lectin-domain containing receptor kinase VII.2 [Tripterygium wilfordii]KAF5731383.1 putative kinase [Tripterygium wilfordii]
MSQHTLYLLFIAILLLLSPATPIEFVYNTDFNSTNLLTYGSATIQSSILALTNDTTMTIGRALYPLKIPTKQPDSSTPIPFSTSFIFSIAPYKNLLRGHGFAFVVVPSTGISGVTTGQFLGLFNLTNNGNSSNHVFAVEFDLFKNEEYNDTDANHVGVDENSLTSSASHTAGFWTGENDSQFKELTLNNGVNYQVWIDCEDSRINVTMAKAGDIRPARPLISTFLNLSGIFLDEMYVGFSGATGQLVQSHKILAWSFSNSNFSIGDALVTMNLPSFVLPKESVFRSKGFIVGVSLGCLFCIGSIGSVYLLILRRREMKRKQKEDIEDWELEYWPHRIDSQEIYAATKGFSEENVIGIGGNGKVYKGVMTGEIEVAVKRIPLQEEGSVRTFLPEISILGRLKHRNLVGIRGWCKRDKGSLALVYDYMENGSLDKRIFGSDESSTLSWNERIKVLKDVASGLLYLHQGWQAVVLHRDIKASNVLLDKDMNARLGDFGLARLLDLDQSTTSTRVIGTVGYMAPEMVRTGRASAKTDVFGFGVLVLEVVCGRRPIEDGKPSLIDWLWRLMERGELVSALDDRIKGKGGYSEQEVERVLGLGLLCSHWDTNLRPKMRQVVKILEGPSEGIDLESEGMEVNLLDRMRTSSIMVSRHPTFDEFGRLISSSGSLTISDLMEGR